MGDVKTIEKASKSHVVKVRVAFDPWEASDFQVCGTGETEY